MRGRAHISTRSRVGAFSAAVVCCALLFLFIARQDSFSLTQDYSPQFSSRSDSAHPTRFADGGEPALSVPVRAYVFDPQLASLRLSAAAVESLPSVLAYHPDVSRAPPLG